MKIVLMRHGKPETDLHTKLNQKYNMHELVSMLRKYENCNLNENQTPDKLSINISKQCNVCVCSNLPRSIQSAKLLGIDQPIIDDLSHELRVPNLVLPSPQLSMRTWVYFYFGIWLLGYSKDSESVREIRNRATIASKKLIKLAEENESTLFVGHGVINRFIGRALLKKGWQRPKKREESYWDFVVYEK